MFEEFEMVLVVIGEEFEGNEKSIPIKSSLKEIEQDFKKEF